MREKTTYITVTITESQVAFLDACAAKYLPVKVSRAGMAAACMEEGFEAYSKLLKVPLPAEAED